MKNLLLYAGLFPGLEPELEYSVDAESLNWYKGLDLNQKINLKEIFVLLCGLEWSAIAFIIPLRQRIDLAYNKLKKEGFDV